MSRRDKRNHNHSALGSSMDKLNLTLDPQHLHHQEYEGQGDDSRERLRENHQPQLANNSILVTTNSDDNDTSSKDFKTGRLLRSSLYRTSYGLMFYSSIFILISSSLLSASKGEDCTPVFEGNDIKDMNMNKGLSRFNEKEVRVVEGSSFNLSCTLPELYSLKWKISSMPQDLSYHKDNFQITLSKISPGIQKTVLYVKNITRNYIGDYTCIVGGCISSSQSQLPHGLKVTVLFAEKPKITHPGQQNHELQVRLKNDVTILCETNNSNNQQIKWQKQLKNDTWIDMTAYCSDKNINKVSKSSCYVETKENNKILSLTINDITEEDYGEYSCGLPGIDSSEEWRKFNEVITLRATDRWDTDSTRRKRETAPLATVPLGKKYEGINYGQKFDNGASDVVKILKKFEKGTNSTIVVEDQPADLSCILQRGPDKDFRDNNYKVAWRIGGVYRIPVSNKLENHEEWQYFENSSFTQIIINSTSPSHKGWYQCVLYESRNCTSKPESGCIAKNLAASYEIQLRVKEKILPLYPFITICVEVLIISAIILIYEKSKSAAEVEESDTDGSPDQKVSDNNIEGISESTRLAKEKE